MFCPACGVTLTAGVKFCHRCGSQLVLHKDPELIKIFEKRMDSEMEGLFWITVLGIGLILGGMALMKRLNFNDWMIVVYMMLSSAAFITYFSLGVWQVRRLAKSSTDAEPLRLPRADTAELPPRTITSLEPVPSVTENTTRALTNAVAAHPDENKG
jgi:hypothetical protein